MGPLYYVEGHNTTTELEKARLRRDRSQLDKKNRFFVADYKYFQEIWSTAADSFSQWEDRLAVLDGKIISMKNSRKSDSLRQIQEERNQALAEAGSFLTSLESAQKSSTVDLRDSLLDQFRELLSKSENYGNPDKALSKHLKAEIENLNKLSFEDHEQEFEKYRNKCESWKRPLIKLHKVDRHVSSSEKKTVSGDFERRSSMERKSSIESKIENREDAEEYAKMRKNFNRKHMSIILHPWTPDMVKKQVYETRHAKELVPMLKLVAFVQKNDLVEVIPDRKYKPDLWVFIRKEDDTVGWVPSNVVSDRIRIP